MNRNHPLHRAQRAFMAGQVAEAERLLQAYVAEHPEDHRAWLWLSGLASSPRQSLRYLERAERLNPGDPAIEQARTWIGKRLAGTAQLDPVSDAHLAAALGITASQNPSAPNPKQRLRSRRRPPAAGHMQAEASPKRTKKLRRPSWLFLAISLLLFAFILGGTVAAVVRGQEQTEPAFVAEDHARENTLAGTNTETALTGATGEPQNSLSTVNSPTPIATEPALPTPTLQPTMTPVPMVLVNPDADDIMQTVSVAEDERWIDVDLSTQQLTAYEGATPVYETIVSSGVAEHPTVTGQFRVWLRYESQTMNGRLLGFDYYLEDVPFVMYFFESYALHGTYWHNNFGTPMSHGCVNLSTADAEWLFNWSSMGTLVNVRS